MINARFVRLGIVSHQCIFYSFRLVNVILKVNKGCCSFEKLAQFSSIALSEYNWEMLLRVLFSENHALN